MVETSTKTPEERLYAIGLVKAKVDGILKKKESCERFMQILDIGNITECEKEMGGILEACATKMKKNLYQHTEAFVKRIADKRWKRVNQLDGAIEWLTAKIKAHGGEFKLVESELDEASGVGIEVTPEQIQAEVDKFFEDNKEQIDELKHSFDW